MLNFELYNPTRLLYGKGQIEEIANLIDKKNKVLVVYGGGSIKKNGVYDQVIKALLGYEVVEFSGVEPNPRYETLVKAVDLIKKEKVDFILGVGGGSVIDGVKFISAAVHFEGEAIDIIQKKLNVNWKAMPYGAILTLPATGSEMNCGAVVTIEATQEKLSFSGEVLYPVFSVCDPTVIASLPEKQIANGITDAFVHVLEQYLTFPQGAPLQDRFAESILQTLIEVAPKILKDPTDYDAAMNYMWCCTMALNGLISKGVKEDWVTHAIGHELTVLYGIDHGRTLAIIGPNLYSVMFETKKEKLAQLGKRVFTLEGSDDKVARLAIERMVMFFHSLGVATKLSDYTEDGEKAVEWIAERFNERGWLAMGEKKNITIDKVREIVKLSL
ncbi:iron-containing alcohol dehydrogenase [Myroides odoratimimus]|uniref:iron-containing alcohol dehydrogenase n=1 Tax=Myroides odoratimimus TaxID=76832 RepID=UPI00103F6AEF|nr:iron-containing alcohol dehydrogenase [Myroides odoratimimus]MDM1494540.1 iron-containing alcohol dehydrogenase [Myroides odoratimimus]QBK75820.1 iron-containing alcohol dehydrogenase [Myroides odoratimimus]WHT74532.1 iron-containing alcohol dehydrogenase [Myroides odoratimimus]WHU39114.1 iron-containing alcohol dehydrogenase [Myroides odoratimimus]